MVYTYSADDFCLFVMVTPRVTMAADGEQL
jgi:hypothetical protein